MAAILDSTLLDTLMATLIANVGRGTSEKIGENSYEVQNVNQSIRDDIDWLQAKDSQLDDILRCTTKVHSRYGL